MSVMFTVDGEHLDPYVERAKRHDLYRAVRDRHFPHPPIATAIIKQVAFEHGVSVTNILSDKRWREIAYARFDAMARLRALPGPNGKPRFSLPHIGWLLGGRDHCTVSNGLKKWAKFQAQSDAKREVEAA